MRVLQYTKWSVCIAFCFCMMRGYVLADGSTNAAAIPKPSVLFLSHPMASHYGGVDLRRNMQRLDRMGYRIAYYAYSDFNSMDPKAIQNFDVVVLLDQPGIDYQGTQKLRPQTIAQFEEIQKLLKD
ncbi:MAG: hypothetical protein KKD33_03225, partial [Verrucomicrobia bacterium]|nr:hypothetical protein [Verrucomicrobiota bacterium]